MGIGDAVHIVGILEEKGESIEGKKKFKGNHYWVNSNNYYTPLHHTVHPVALT